MTRMTKRLLLISNSTLHGSGYLDHAEAEIRSFLQPVGAGARVLFFPYALKDRDGYAARARARLAAMGSSLDSMHEIAGAAVTPGSAAEAIHRADVLFVGGGNTFRLLDCLHRLGLVTAIRRAVEQGKPYIGSSAGAIVACPTLKTTKDMPVVQPPCFDALHLVNFQISPHYLDPDPNSTHMGETQEERIMQYLEDNDRPVVGLREGTLQHIHKGAIQLRGSCSARIFRRGSAPREVSPDTFLTAVEADAATLGKP